MYIILVVLHCCKGSLGGIAIKAIYSIILSLLDKSVPRGCVENLEKLNSYGSPLNSTETLPFLQSTTAPQVLRKCLPKIIGKNYLALNQVQESQQDTLSFRRELQHLSQSQLER